MRSDGSALGFKGPSCCSQEAAEGLRKLGFASLSSNGGDVSAALCGGERNDETETGIAELSHALW